MRVKCEISRMSLPSLRKLIMRVKNNKIFQILITREQNDIRDVIIISYAIYYY